jgi:4-hydroxy-3-methylbut-2-enyl diphosphate reductase
LERDYHSHVVDYLRRHDFRLRIVNMQIHLAQEFGVCYGVDRAVEYAYQAREKFPDHRIFLTGEIIHNPHVNRRMIEMGIGFLSGDYSNGVDIDNLTPEDVVILPAFGVSVAEFHQLSSCGCILVDTTCGSVLNVWKRVEQYARDGFTSVIHGKYFHEETKATSSQATKYPGGHYLVVRNMEEAEQVCEFIVGERDREKLLAHFAIAISPGFDPDLHLQKIGVANQTTMLSSESLAIAERLRASDDAEIRRGRHSMDIFARLTRFAARRRIGRTRFRQIVSSQSWTSCSSSADTTAATRTILPPWRANILEPTIDDPAAWSMPRSFPQAVRPPG